MNETLIIRSGKYIVGAALKSEVIGVSYENGPNGGFFILVHLRNGSTLKGLVGYSSQVLEDVLLQIISDMGWT